MNHAKLPEHPGDPADGAGRPAIEAMERALSEIHDGVLVLSALGRVDPTRYEIEPDALAWLAKRLRADVDRAFAESEVLDRAMRGPV